MKNNSKCGKRHIKDKRLSLMEQINENAAALSDEQIIQLMLSFVFKKDWEKIWSKIENEIIEPSSLLDIDALCMLFGKNDENVIAFFKALKRITEISEAPEVKIGDVYFDDDLGELFKNCVGGELVENLFVAFLSGDDRLLGIKRYSSFEKDRVRTEISDTVREALWRKAEKVIIAHNHSSGTLVCSENDFQLTTDFGAELNAAGIILAEHFVVSKDGYVRILEASKEMMNGGYRH